MFLPDNLQINTWEDINPMYQKLLNDNVLQVNEMIGWLHNRSDLEAFLEEDLAWRYIKMSCNTADADLASHYSYFIEHIEPNIQQHGNLLDKKFLGFENLDQLSDIKYQMLIREIKSKNEIYRDENLSLTAQMQLKEQAYGKIASEMSIEHNNEVLTLQKAANFLRNKNEDLRKDIYHKINNRRLKDAESLDLLFDNLVKIRHQIALNAGFLNYRDYKFVELSRFDYGVTDCINFHNSVEKVVMPLVHSINKNKLKYFGAATLKPWNTEFDIYGENPLQPFENTRIMLDKTIACFNAIDPEFAGYLQTMDTKGYFDLDSRVGKAPGGFNYPLYKSDIPFIFMNASGNLRDLVTIVHEGGHAVHSFLSAQVQLVPFKSFPSEVAELASMSMELITMEHWDLFFNNKQHLLRAKIEHLEGIIEVLPWIALIDSFQHKIYEQPQLSTSERTDIWMSETKRFLDASLDYSEHMAFLEIMWQKQLHIFEVPFYYIEYGFAQLGAIAIWKNYVANPKETLQNYKKALALGYTKPINEIYETAGIPFNFSESYIKSLTTFVQEKLNNLYSQLQN